MLFWMKVLLLMQDDKKLLDNIFFIYTEIKISGRIENTWVER